MKVKVTVSWLHHTTNFTHTHTATFDSLTEALEVVSVENTDEAGEACCVFDTTARVAVQFSSALGKPRLVSFYAAELPAPVLDYGTAQTVYTPTRRGSVLAVEVCNVSAFGPAEHRGTHLFR